MEELSEQIRTFTQQRDWDQFHSPKNLSMALGVEAAEIMEIFQWMTQEESKLLDDGALSRLEEEIGDVMIYLVGLADKFGLDPVSLAKRKIGINVRKYPADVVRGRAKKYSEY
ncbi:nucleotide pyrophosphohydrolase [Chloroflexota bacterium]